MKLILLSILVFSVLLEGLGTHILHKLNHEVQGYAMLYGFACFLAFCQICFYPVQILHGSFYFLAVIVLIAGTYSFYCMIKERNEVFARLFSRKTFILLAGLGIFCFIFYRCYIDMEFADSPMYLNYISQNIENPHINLFNLYTGKLGSEWDTLYMYQGYYHFVSVYVWLLNRVDTVETLKASVWGMGMLYSILSTSLIVNIIESLKIERKTNKIILYVLAMGYLNLYYWRVVDAYYGNTWRTLFITLMMFTIWKWQKDEYSKKQAYILIPAIGFAGIACSSTFLACSFAVLIILAAYLYIEKKDHVFQDMMIFIIPLVIYAVNMLRYQSRGAYLLGVLFLLYYLLSGKEKVIAIFNRFDCFIEKRAKLLFYAIFPGIIALAALLLQIKDPDFLYGYSYWFRNHQDVDMVKDYFFVYSTWYDNIMNVIRWISVILFLRNAAKPEDRYLKVNFVLMLLVFMNPLCTPAIANYIASNVFYRIWEVMFNPFTELVLFSTLLNSLEGKKQLVLVPQAAIALVVLVSNLLALQGNEKAQYGFYISHKGDVDSLTKMEPEAVEIINALDYELQENPVNDRQPVVISQAEGTRVYLPQAYQLITARDTYYTDTRINEDLYQIARRHHPWDEPVEAPYEDTCSLLKRYNTDYIILRYWENPEFDTASDACTFTVCTSANFKLKKVS